jgi:MraZ protein
MVFLGRYNHAIDDKGRVSIPARFRDALTREDHDSLYITNFYFDRETCLELLPPSQWEQLLVRVREKGRFDPDMQAFETFYIGGAYEVPVDRQGRILIPPRLREFAQLDHEVTFSTRRDHFQMWNKEIFERVIKANDEKMKDPQFFAKLEL